MNANRKLLTLLVALVLAGCVGGSSPREAAEGYLQALSELNFERASQFVGDEGRRDFQALKQLYGQLGPEERKKFQLGTWNVTDEWVSGDTATVDFTFDQVKRGQLTLHRTGAVWLVDHRRTF
jgi:hypothetical protein